MTFLATEFLSFNIKEDCIDNQLYLVSDVKLILTGAWPCHVPIFLISKSEKKFYGKMT